jgi:hypothetical protein
MWNYLTIKNGPVVDGMESEEVVYAADQPEYLPLRSLVSEGPERRVISRWTLNENARQAIASGADIYLELSTFGQPLQPIRMAVSDGKLDDDWVRVCLLDGKAKMLAKAETVSEQI